MESENMNSIYRKIHYIDWRNEAEYITVSQDEIKQLLKDLAINRIQTDSKCLRSEFTENTYGVLIKGDYISIFMKDHDKYLVISSNAVDRNKNEKKLAFRPDREFDSKFKEFNGLSLRKAFGFVDKTIKRCIPKQFYYKTDSTREFGHVSCIDASSQYPSGCLGKLPDSHTAVFYKGTIQPTAEYPFAFYASGHMAIYNELDTHTWVYSKFAENLFRLRINQDDYPLIICEPADDYTILMKASDYTMNDTWNYFYNLKKACKKDSDEYLLAKLVMNACIGCWHRKDKEKKAAFTYDDHGSYQLAHIVAVAIARGNQKILNKVDEIGYKRILHICVDGIIYKGTDKFGIDESKFGEFAQEFTDCKFRVLDYNVYAAEKNGEPVKFKHGGFDLIHGHEIDESIKYSIKDLDYLGRKETIEDVLKNEKIKIN